jgi:hypothetical protein
MQDQVAGNFEQKVPEKKETGSETEDPGSQAKLNIHLQRGKADVHAIEERYKEADNQKR